MHLPLLDVGEPFSPFVWIRDATQALLLYFYLFFVSGSGGTLGVQGANSGHYLVGVGIGDVTGYVSPLPTMLPIPHLIPVQQPSRRD